MMNKVLSNELMVSLNGIVNKVDLAYEEVVPEVNVYTNNTKTSSGRTRLTIVIGLHDAVGYPDRARFSVSLPKDTSAKEVKNQRKMIESKLSDILKEKYDSYEHHDFLKSLELFVASKRGEMRDSSVDSYEYRMKKVVQYFNRFHYSVESISPRVIKEFIDWMKKSGKGNNTGLSYRTIKDTHGLLYGFFKDQINQEVITINPCEHTELPHDNKPNVEADDVRWLNLDEYNNLMDWLVKYKDDYSCPFWKLYDMIRLTIYSGMRKEEILALQWDAVDFEGGHFEIKRTRTKGKKIYDIDDVKSPASHRSYPITEEVEDLLLGLKKRTEDECSNSKYVFSWSEKDSNRWEGRSAGSPYDPDYISDIMNKLIKRYKKETGTDLDGITFHKLRHSCCSILYDKGWSLGEVQQWLGHEDSEVTKRIYLHKQEAWKDSKAQDLKFLWKKHNEVN
ncbi:MAG: site-specific integrase [Lachnospiraceae bacterium]|nr:site-specific integrase [Butyrivibrio sp.]MBQ9333505.1 site-specific integrase [Lachnospiraceae bacterium]